MEKSINKFNSDNILNNIVFIPKGEDIENLPLLIYLHGAGERGNNIDHLYRHAIPKLIEEGYNYRAVILCPQCPANAVWDNITEKIKNTIDYTVKKYNLKKDRITITGSSMGGFGTWMMGLTYRSFFAAIAPVSGGGMSWRSQNLKATPIYAVHGDLDNVVPIDYSLMMVREAQKYNSQVTMNILNGCGHNDGIDKAYRDGDLINWLLEQRRGDFSPIPEILEEMF